MRIAQFRQTVIGFDTILTEHDATHEVYTREYARTSEWMDVTFTPRGHEERAREELALFDTAEAELRQKFADKLEQIATERAKLRAITHQSADV